ncbi:MAG TPA: 30S ribosomal protein S16, partial [Longimicrobiaceae bacterium]|nr:30S ribosomal protein S16 [Longimicrobiaceae bacterium]
MALRIRLRRMGRKKAPHYRIVVAESTMPRDGRFVATIGHYNPTTEPTTLKVDRDKALAWMARGAMPTDTVQSLFKKGGVYHEPTVVESVVSAVSGAASAAADAAKGAASAAADVAKGAADVAKGAATRAGRAAKGA